MPLQFNREIEKLKIRIVKLGSLVEQSVQKAVFAIKTGDDGLAQAVINGDTEIDHMEVDIEEDCLKILALYQPVAKDLRFIISVLKMNSDLERIGDLAVKIAKHATTIDPNVKIKLCPDYIDMAFCVEDMLKKSLDSVVNMDARLAEDVRSMDDHVDSLNREIRSQILANITREPENSDGFIEILSIPRYLERIADHAVNIAEDVIYTTQGKIVRHE